MQPMANIALRAARKAGDFMLRAMDRPEEFDIETKAHNDFVSNIDKTAEAIIIDQIRETFPDHAIIGEESARAVWEQRVHLDHRPLGRHP